MKILNKLIKTITLIIVIFQLSSCGGGGGGGGGAPPPPPPPPDTTPNAFSFINVVDVPIDSLIESNEITITGIDESVSITVSGGEYSINNSDYTGSQGTINNGQTAKLRVNSSEEFNTSSSATLTVGGISAMFIVTTNTAAEIHFPPSSSFTEGDSITVRGSSNISNPEAVTVNGIDADSTDGFLTWSADIPLQAGPNIIQVDLEDSDQNIIANAVQASITKNPFFDLPKSIAIDDTYEYAYVIDDFTLDTAGIVKVDLTTGAREIISDSQTPNGNNPLFGPQFIAFDSLNQRLLVTSTHVGIIAVDINSGERTIFTDISPPLSTPSDIAIDNNNNRALVLNDTQVVAVDLTTGNKNVLSNNLIPNTDLPFDSLGSIAVDSANGRALVFDREPNLQNESRLFSVNLNDGGRTIFSSNSIPEEDPQNSQKLFQSTGPIVIDSAHNRALSLPTNSGVISVNLTDGTKTVLSNPNITNSQNLLNGPRDFDVDVTGNRALVVNAAGESIIAVNLATGERSYFSGNNIPNADNQIVAASFLFLYESRGQLIVRDGFNDQVVIVDINSGERNKPFETIFHQPMALDEANNRLFAIRFTEELITMDLDTGNETLISNASSPGGENLFTTSLDPIVAALDIVDNRIIFLDGFFGTRALWEIDIATGAANIISGSSVPDSTNDFIRPSDIALDQENGRAYVVDTDINALLAVDLTTGVRTILSDNTTPGTQNPFTFPAAVALDTDSNTAYVVDVIDQHYSKILAVDLTSGERTIVTDENSPNSFNQLGFVRALTIDKENNRIYVSNDNLQGRSGIITVDLADGQRTILSQ